jgi:hypothetical protein
MSVLQNDLFGAFSKADLLSRAALFHICELIHCYAPIGSYGSPEKVRAWLDKKSNG